MQRAARHHYPRLERSLLALGVKPSCVIWCHHAGIPCLSESVAHAYKGDTARAIRHAARYWSVLRRAS